MLRSPPVDHHHKAQTTASTPPRTHPITEHLKMPATIKTTYRAPTHLHTTHPTHTPRLLVASKRGHCDVAQTLLDSGAEVLAKEKTGKSTG